MQGQPTDFWGKLQYDDRGTDRQGVVVGWHPLIDHCADVAAVCEALLRRTLLRQRLARLAGLTSLSDTLIERLGVLAALHDIGKFNHGFRFKAFRNTGTAGHLEEVLALLNPHNGYQQLTGKLFASIQAEQLGDWGTHPDGNDIYQLLIATISHHGRPMRTDRREKIVESYWAPVGDLDPFAGIARLVAQTQQWFPAAWLRGGAKLPAQPEFQHAWSGLLMLADWLGSDDANDRFPFRQDGNNEDRMPFARRRAQRVLKRIGLDPAPARRALTHHCGDAAPGFRTMVPKGEPWAAQRVMIELPVDETGSVTVLESETGSGKTEAALVRYARLFHAGQVDGMVFALPTRTAATQIHRRVHEAIQHAFPEEDTRPAVVLGVPGYLRVDQTDGTRLARFDVLWPDQDRNRHRAWAAEASKRYLAGPIVVATIDQVLLSALQVGHAELRASALLRQFLVVDEVHASDAYMTRILHLALDHHRRAGGHALLLSATLCGAARTQLLAERDHGRSSNQTPPLDEALSAPYPAVSHQPVAGHLTVRAVASDRPEKAVQIQLHHGIAEPDTVANEALAAARDGAKVLVIRNTVKDCVATQHTLETSAGEDPVLFRCCGVVAPHHSRFADQDRQQLDKAIETSFGKQRLAGGQVAIATQTVEQSLDLDADLLITDLCPMDVLLQRIGRLHRHPRSERPEPFAQARAVVLVPADGDLSGWVEGDSPESTHGLGTVYSDLRILEATWSQLRPEPVLNIPRDNRRLVEESVHPERLSTLATTLGDAWLAHQQSVWGQLVTETHLAELNGINRRIAYGAAGYLFPDHGERKIPTRLGLDDRQVRFESPVRSPFGQTIDSLTIPDFLAKGVPGDLEVATDVEEASDKISFRLGTHTYVYTRIGLQLVSPVGEST